MFAEILSRARLAALVGAVAFGTTISAAPAFAFRGPSIEQAGDSAYVEAVYYQRGYGYHHNRGHRYHHNYGHHYGQRYGHHW